MEWYAPVLAFAKEQKKVFLRFTNVDPPKALDFLLLDVVTKPRTECNA
jgi:hypothetical protein